MSQFLTHAGEIFETACAAAADAEDLAILVEPRGQIHIVMGTSRSSEALESFAGAGAAYRVSHGPNGVRVEGREGFQRCTLERPSLVPARKALSLLGLTIDRPLYSTLPAAA